jgi:hypothetical protein
VALPDRPLTRTAAEATVQAVRFDPRGRFLFAAGDDRVVRALGSSDVNPAWSAGFLGQGDLVNQFSALLEPSGRALLVFVGERIELWDVATGRRRRTIPAPFRASPDGRSLVVTDKDDQGLSRWNILDVATDEWVFRSEPQVAGGPYRADFTADGRYLLLGGLPSPPPAVGPPVPSDYPARRQSVCAVVDVRERRLVGTLPIPDWLPQARDPFARSSAPPALSNLNRPTVLTLDRVDGTSTLRAFDLVTATPLGAADLKKLPIGPLDRIQLSSDGRTALIPVVKPGVEPSNPKRALHVWRVESSEMQPIETTFDDPFDAYGSRMALDA